MTDETRLYNCGGIPVKLTLPEGEHTEIPQIGYFWSYRGENTIYCPINPLCNRKNGKSCNEIKQNADETRLYNCGGLPVELTLPEGEHEENWGYPFEWEIELVSELAEYDDF